MCNNVSRLLVNVAQNKQIKLHKLAGHITALVHMSHLTGSKKCTRAKIGENVPQGMINSCATFRFRSKVTWTAAQHVVLG